jgi:hypothetical protein
LAVSWLTDRRQDFSLKSNDESYEDASLSFRIMDENKPAMFMENMDMISFDYTVDINKNSEFVNNNFMMPSKDSWKQLLDPNVRRIYKLKYSEENPNNTGFVVEFTKDLSSQDALIYWYTNFFPNNVTLDKDILEFFNFSLPDGLKDTSLPRQWSFIFDKVYFRPKTDYSDIGFIYSLKIANWPSSTACNKDKITLLYER